MTGFIYQHCYRSSLYTLAVVLGLVIGLVPISLAQTTAASSTGKVDSAQDTTLPEVVVSGTKEKKVAPKEGSAESGYKVTKSMVGPLGDMSWENTPYSINAVSGEQIENRQVHTLFEAVQSNPSVSNLLLPNVQSSMVQLMIRGADASDAGELRDGLTDRSFTHPPLENVERVEILNGFSGFLYGITNVGGAFNFITKQPTSTPIATISAGMQGGGMGFFHIDLGGPIAHTQGKLGTRLNVYKEDGNSFLEGSSSRRALLSDAISIQLTKKTVLTADIYAQDAHQHGLATYFNAADYTDNMWTSNGINVPSASKFSAMKQYGQNWTYTSSQKVYGGLLLDSKLNEMFSFKAAVRYGQMWRGYNYIDAILIDNAGNYKEKLYDNVPQHERTNAEYALLNAKFHTKSVHHDLTFGNTGHYMQFEKASYNTAVLGTSNIVSVKSYSNPHLTLPAANIVREQPASNVLLGDHLQLTQALSALLGVNYTAIWYDAWDKSSKTHTSAYSQHAFTPTYALTYRLPQDVYAYFSYIQALSTGGTAPSSAKNAYDILPPSIDGQYEVGAKAKVQGAQLSLALFHMNLVNEYTAPDGYYKKDGRQINKGVEFTASGKATKDLTLIGGFSFMNSRITREKDNTAIEHKIPVNVPEQQVRLYAEYNLPQATHLTPTFAANYSGRRPIDTSNAHFIDGSTIFDAGLRYDARIISHSVKLVINATNIGNKSYWATYYSGDGIILGQPRIVSFSAKYAW